MPRAKQRTPELRERVLREAVATLAGHGVAGFTTRTVARRAGTSTPAVYELFGDKAGLVREVFFEGFRLLADRLAGAPVTGDARADVVGTVAVLRGFVRDHPVLADVMFSRPFADFDPGPAERRAGDATREAVLSCVRRAAEAGIVAGDPRDVAHVLLALVQGLAAQEAAGWLGSSPASVDRRWALAVDTLLAGLALPREG